MSITSAFNNAFSGLNASSRRAELISNNISNALTDGFSRREIHLSSLVLNGQGGGVRVDHVSRAQNANLTSARREAEALVSSSSTTSNFLTRIADNLGGPGELGALGVQFSELESSFIGAANDPGNEGRLNEVLSNARNIVDSLNDKSVFANELRLETDAEISRQVTFVNQTLEQISELNKEVRAREASGGSTAALFDQRGILLDQLNSIIPIKTVPREHGRIAVFTPSGGTLLDGVATKFDFSEVPAMAHNMTLVNGALSDLTANGHSASMQFGNNLFSGGSLESLFRLRDQVLPQFNDELDALATNLSLRFQNPGVDPTLTPGDPGMFTDAGAPVLAVNSLGIAGRITLNSAFDPMFGGGAWKLRAGINATAQVDIGENGILRGYQDAMQVVGAPSAGMGTSTRMSATGFAEQFVSALASEKTSKEDVLVYQKVRSDDFRVTELAMTAVDSDAELQNLMEVEAAYTANARVMSVLDELLNRLLEI